jgi:hypothetical protein
MCNEVVSYPPGGQQDPNAAVERHILSGTCSAMEGGAARKKAELKRKKQAGKVCYRGGCTKVIIAPMKCDQCKHIFCPPHRHETSHSCKATPTSSGANTPAPSTSRSRSTTPGVKTPLSRLVSSAPSSSFASSASKPLASPVAAVQAAGPQLEARAAAAAAAMKRAGQDVKVPFVKTKTEK